MPLGLQLYLKIDSGTYVFLWILQKIFKNTFFTEHLLATTSNSKLAFSISMRNDQATSWKTAGKEWTWMNQFKKKL